MTRIKDTSSFFDVRSLLECENEEFLVNAYVTLLGREPDKIGLSHYARRLQIGIPREAILAEIWNTRLKQGSPVSTSADMNKLMARYQAVRGLPLGKMRWRLLPRFGARIPDASGFDWVSWASAYARNSHASVKTSSSQGNTFVMSADKEGNHQAVIPLADFKLRKEEILIKQFTNGTKNVSTILFISHDASLTGAPKVLINLIGYLKEKKGITPVILYGGNSDDRKCEFEDLGECFYMPEINSGSINALAEFLRNKKIDVVYANTVASGRLLEVVRSILDAKVKCVAHVHEMNEVLHYFSPEAAYIGKVCDEIIVVSRESEGFFKKLAKGIDVLFIPPFISSADFESSPFENEIPVVFGCGTIEPRKGFDLFCETLAKLRQSTNVKFKGVWIGPSSLEEEPALSLRKHSVDDLVVTIGKHKNPRSLYKKGDVFFVSSREDPYPLVGLEAAEQGLPIVSFDKRASPGMDEFIRNYKSGLICNYLDTDDAAHCLRLILENPEMGYQMGANGRFAVINYYNVAVISDEIYKFIITDNCYPLTSKRIKVIIVSFGPVPVFGLNIMEGGGLRAWGLAQGIVNLGPLFEVYVTFRRSYLNHPNPGMDSGINILTWSCEEDLYAQIVGKDIVIVSYCFGGVSKRIADSVKENQILVLDCYVPIHPEVCARDSRSLIDEYVAFKSDEILWDDVICKGDYLLCASEAQKNYYLGLLFGLKKINPINYSSADNIIVAPFGIYDDPLPLQRNRPVSALVSDNSFKVLWFGGVYPWFDIEGLMNAIANIREEGVAVELVVVGAKNPFNSHPDFVRLATRITSLSQEDKFKDFIHLVDWVPYHDRLDWYRDADLLISYNRPGIENRLSWRTRIVDYLYCESFFATNGGDPISDALIDAGLGFRLQSDSVETLSYQLKKIISDMNEGTHLLRVDRLKLKELKERLSWVNIASFIMRPILSDPVILKRR